MSVLQKKELLEVLACTLMESQQITNIVVRVEHGKERVFIMCDGVRKFFMYSDLIELMGTVEEVNGYDEWIDEVIVLAEGEGVVYKAGPMAAEYFNNGASPSEFWTWFYGCGFTDKDFGILVKADVDTFDADDPLAKANADADKSPIKDASELNLDVPEPSAD